MEGEVSAFAEHVQLYKPLSKGNSWGLLLTQAPLEEGGGASICSPSLPCDRTGAPQPAGHSRLRDAPRLLHAVLRLTPNR